VSGAQVDWAKVIEKLEAHIHRERRRLVECQGKRVFLNPTDAILRRPDAGRVSAYKCEFCGLYHMGGHRSSMKRPRPRTGFLRTGTRFGAMG